MLRNIDDMQQWELEMELAHLIGWVIASRNSAAEADECARKHREAEKEALARISKVRQRLGLPNGPIDSGTAQCSEGWGGAE
ncbi:hypothetical protein LG331_09220 [Vreelandella aquamarina]|uniref:hypothetical protein n=1 Tax=Vreelandella aquamarina TaxID=77097 RepID=UPI00384F4A0C